MKNLPLYSKVHSASAAMTGYLFQARYALLRGLEEGRDHPNRVLSIEKFDDVAFEEAESPIELIQTKHHGTQGDVSDSSVDIWRTLYIWIKQSIEDPIDAANTRLVFLTTNSAAEGSALSMLRQVNGKRDEVCAIELLVSAAKASQNQETATARKTFLNLTNTEREALVRNIWVFDSAPKITDMRDKIKEILHYSAPTEQVSNLTDQLEGWWFCRIVNALTNQDLGKIPLIAIQNKVSELRENFKVKNLLLNEEIEKMPINNEWPNDKLIFIHQMNLIDVSKVEMRAAALDYYRAYAQRSLWARENLLLDRETDKYDFDLWDVWQRQFLEYTSDNAEDCEDHTKRVQGKKVFHWARKYQKPLRNRDEIWLSSGSLQILADQMRIGWHPDYETLISQLKEEI